MNNFNFSLKSRGTISAPEKKELGEASCQGCGKLVMIWSPFHGCVFCEDCRRVDRYFTIPDMTE